MMPLSWVGKTIGGRYQIEALLGQGGMSAVYRASDPNLRRPVAIKLIHPHLSTDPNFIGRFKEEAAAVARLRHPNIVQVHDFNQDGNTYYMVMEYLVGETLQTRLKRLNASGRLMPLDEAVNYCIQVCEAAGYAHDHELVHRDIKPANIMLNVNGQAILMDFGIVKIIGGDYHTATGATIGTAMYMSPEQIRSERIDDRADIYSLGVTLYEMLSGRPPYMADSALTLMMMVLNDPLPDLSEARSAIPQELQAVVNQALAKNPSNRYQTMAQMASDLRQVLAQMVGLPPEPAPTLVDEADASPSGSLTEPATIYDSSQNIPAASSSFTSSAQPSPASADSLQPAGKSASVQVDQARPSKPVTPLPSQPIGQTGLSPSRSTRRRLWAGLSVLVLVLLAGFGYYFLSQSKPPSLQLTPITLPALPLDPQVAHAIVNLGSWQTDSYIEQITFSPQGLLLGTANNRDYMRFSNYRFYSAVWDVPAGSLSNTFTAHSQWVMDVAFSPDGQLFASSADDGSLSVWKVSDGSLVHKIVYEHGGLTGLAFSPNQLLLAASGWDGRINLWQVSDWNLLRSIEASELGLLDIAFSPDGALLAAPAEDSSILIFQVSDGKLVHSLQDHASQAREVSFSPDGSLLASASEDHTIKIWEVDSGLLQYSLVGHQDTVYDLAFSSDGSLLASGSADGTLRLWRVMDGTALVTVTEYWDGIKSVAFSPDDLLLVSAAADGMLQFWGISEAIPIENP